MLDRHEERELDRLLLHDRGIRAVLGRRQLVQQLVGIGLQPQDLARHRRPRALVEGVQAGVGRDLVQPGPERGPAGERRPPPPRTQERLLDKVLAVVEGAEHPVAVQMELPVMALKQFSERSVIGGDGHVSVTAIATKTHQPVAPKAPVRLCAFRDSPLIRVGNADRGDRRALPRRPDRRRSAQSRLGQARG